MSESQNKRRPAPSGTGPRLTHAASATEPDDDDVPTPPPAGARLKVVTVSPGRASFADTEFSGAEPRSASARDPYLGATIDDRYLVEAVLGEGGMGVVYRCSHTIIGKKVAMKLLRADLARDSEVTERFLNEAKAASGIGNPHIIDISDFGQFPDGSTYFIMEYLVGSSLAKVMEGGQPVPTERLGHIARQLAEGLAAAHASGIVHRDLKPDNIFLIDRGAQKDFVKILDFGIAKVSSATSGKLTRAGAVFGTPHYMSPEQAAGAPVDHRGDIYSIGVILYEMASGRVPFDADNFMGILTQHMYKAPEPFRAFLPEPEAVPPGLEAIVLKCLSKRPEDRYATMEALIGDLDKLRRGEVPDAVNEMMARSGGFAVPADYFNTSRARSSRPTLPRELGSRRRWSLIAAAVGVVAAVGIVFAIVASGGKGSPEPPLAKESAAPVGAPPQPSAAPEPEPRKVVVAAEPLDAHVFLGTTDLGASPVMLEVPEGESVELKIRRDGYKEATLSVNGASQREVIQLERLPRPGAIRPAAQKPKAAPKPPEKTGKRKPGSNGEIVNPWD